jgi:hypothetical protein
MEECSNSDVGYGPEGACNTAVLSHQSTYTSEHV